MIDQDVRLRFGPPCLVDADGLSTLLVRGCSCWKQRYKHTNIVLFSAVLHLTSRQMLFFALFSGPYKY